MKKVIQYVRLSAVNQKALSEELQPQINKRQIYNMDSDAKLELLENKSGSGDLKKSR